MQRKRKGFHKKRQPKYRFRINDYIRVPEVRLVGDNVEQGIYPLAEAKKIAREQQLDLVEISPTAKPPVCRIIDFQKFLYDKKKKEKEIKAKTVKVEVKEVRFTPNTGEHDFEVKARHAEKWLQDGAKVKAWVQFKGRNLVFTERGEVLLLRLAQRLEEFGVPEQLPKMEGKRKMQMIITPKKK